VATLDSEDIEARLAELKARFDSLNDSEREAVLIRLMSLLTISGRHPYRGGQPEPEPGRWLALYRAINEMNHTATGAILSPKFWPKERLFDGLRRAAVPFTMVFEDAMRNALGRRGLVDSVG
jgi:hypothetical protein